jgi:hypothetical protein
MTSVAIPGAAAERRRRANLRRAPHEGAEPWGRSGLVVLAVLLVLGVAGITVGWAGAGGKATLDDQRGWLGLAIAALILTGFVMAGWLLVGMRRIALLRAPVVAEVRRRKRAELAARPRVVRVEVDPPSGFAVLPGTRRYHRPDCLLLTGKDVAFGPIADHEADGRLPCGVCLPAEAGRRA